MPRGKQMNDISDEDLMNAISLKNAEAYRTLATRYMDDLFFLARRILRDPSEAEDVVQNVFLRIWEEPARWQPAKGRLKAWLWAITSNACRDVLRKSKRLVHSDGGFEEFASPQAAPDRKAEAVDQLNHILQQIAALPEGQQTALYLQVYDDLSYKEIASVMNVSADAVESLIARARKNLRANSLAQSTQNSPQKKRKRIQKNQKIKIWSHRHANA